jgi:methyl-accepting chemotaxis protein
VGAEAKAMGWSIAKKLFGIAGVSVAALAGVGGIALWGFGTLEQAEARVRQTSLALHQHMEADMMHDAVRGDVFHMLLSAPAEIPPIAKDLSEHAATLRKGLADAEATTTDPAVKALIQEVKPEVEEYIGVAEEMMARGAKEKGNPRELLPRLGEHFDSLEDRLEKVSQGIEASAKAAEDEATASTKHLTSILWFATIIAALTAAVAARFGAWSITKALAETIAKLKRVAAGDLESTHAAKSDEKSDDELSQLAHALHDAIGAVNARAEALVGQFGSVLARVADRDMTARASDIMSSAKTDATARRLAGSLDSALSNMDESLCQVAEAAEHVSSAAAEISSAGQSLAQATSTGAASIANLTGNLKDMVDMAQRNTTHAHEAKDLAESAQQTAERGADAMRRLSESVTKIKSSADQTARIVKTIDEIAFQTNLLALNAAVEAARAGDAGRGFAVVAEEVRNLAMRSAEAARSTSELIEGSVRSAGEGVTLNGEVLANLEEITAQVSRVAAVMAEIASASEHQRAGAVDANKSVDQMSDLTSNNAASCEESAATAEQLAHQARALRDLVSSFRLTRGARRAVTNANRNGAHALPSRSNGHANGSNGNGASNGSALLFDA